MDILKAINEVVNEYAGKNIELTVETDFDSLGFDSLDKVEILMRLEERFDVTFDDDLQVKSVTELIDAIEKLKK